jgi:hypothetical protein
MRIDHCPSTTNFLLQSCRTDGVKLKKTSYRALIMENSARDDWPDPAHIGWEQQEPAAILAGLRSGRAAEAPAAWEQHSLWDDGRRLKTHLTSFAHFVLLPIELRRKIWCEFCPDLATKARVFEIEKWSDRPDPDAEDAHGYLRLARHVRQQTAATRALLSIHRESRGFALDRFPDKLALSPRSQRRLPLSLQNDVVLMHIVQMNSADNQNPWMALKGTPLAGVQNVATYDFAFAYFYYPYKVQHEYPSLRRLYIVLDEGSFKHDLQLADGPKAMRWCVADGVRECRLSARPLSRLGEHRRFEEHEVMYCWPKIPVSGPTGVARQRWFPIVRGAADGEPLDVLERKFHDYNANRRLNDAMSRTRVERASAGLDAPWKAVARQAEEGWESPELRYEIGPMMEFTQETMWLYEKLKAWNGDGATWAATDVPNSLRG